MLRVPSITRVPRANILLHSRDSLCGCLMWAMWVAGLSAPPPTITWTNLTPAGTRYAYSYGNHSNQVVGISLVGVFERATLWRGSPEDRVILHPAGADSARVLCLTASQQGGYANFKGTNHAALWSGVSNSFVDLHPVGSTDSSVQAMNDTQQAGYYRMDGMTRAALWSGTAGSLVDLHPAGATSSSIWGMTDEYQVGRVKESDGFRATLWRGRVESRVDVHPANATDSTLYAASGSQQAGVAVINGRPQAGLWSGTAASFVNLHPAGLRTSSAGAVGGGFQAGYAEVAGQDHAALWTGTPESFVDLHLALGTQFIRSTASGVWSDGVTTYVSGTANINFSPSYAQAILWKIVTPLVLTVVQATVQEGTNLLTLTWTNLGSAVSLESGATPVGAWHPVNGLRTTNHGWVVATITNTAPARFFRLISP